MEHSVLEIWQSMGVVAKATVVVLLGMSVIAVAVAVERVFVLLGGRKKAVAYADRVEQLVAEGDVAGAAALDPGGGGSLVRVLAAGVEELAGAQRMAPSRAELLDCVDVALGRAVDAEVGELRRGLSSLATIGSTAPFVGLFGTVVGIVNAFGEISRTGGGGVDAVSGGIAEALVATALGILVAVPAVVLFNFFSSRAEAAESQLSDRARSLYEAARRSTWENGGRVPVAEEGDASRSPGSEEPAT